MTDTEDRTLTARRAAHADADVANIPLLVQVGRASQTGAWGPRWSVGGRGWRLGRKARDQPGAGPGVFSLDDPLASSQHAHLQIVGDVSAPTCTLTDLGSKNGTWLNGVQVVPHEPQEVSDGSLIFIGQHALSFRWISLAQHEALNEEVAAPFAPVVTLCPRLALLNQKLKRLALSPAEIFLLGETGVGKEVYAHAIHAHSQRSGPLIAVNCAAIPKELVESELFGFRAGAHSTAQSAKPGLLEAADGGTLFLDEIGEMPAAAQSKLLRFLQDQKLTPLGGTKARQLNVRIIAATNREPMPGQPAGLRDDFVARLGAAPIRLLPLRARKEDLGALWHHFVGAGFGLDVAAWRTLVRAPFALNVRELHKVAVAAMALAGADKVIGLSALPDAMSAAGADGPVHVATRNPRGTPLPATPSGRKAPEPAPGCEEIAALLVLHKGNVADVARALGRQRAAVWRWIKRYHLDPDDFRKAGAS